MHKSHGLKALERVREKNINKKLKEKIHGFHFESISRSTFGHFWYDVKSFLYDFCLSTSLNGFRLITAKTLSLNENRVWAMICLLASVICAYLMEESWDKSLNQSTLIQLDSIDSSINELDFPAVTVCNHNQIYKPEADKFLENLTEAGFTKHQIEQFFQNLPVLIRPFKFPKVDLEIGGQILQHLNIPVKKLMRQLMQPCAIFIKRCRWVNKIYNCSSLFKVSESYLGYCCAFNYQVSPTFVDKENEAECKSFYDKNDLDNDIQCEVDAECPGRKSILRVPGSGLDVSVRFHVHLEPSQYLGMTKDFKGASVLINDAHAYPEHDIYEQAVQPGEHKSIILKGTKFESEEEIRRLPLEIRKCTFKNELQYDYSYQSCIAKCRMIRFSKVCGCVPFYYPATCKDIERTCNFSNVKCIKKNIGMMRKLHERIILDNGQVLETCDCMPMCNKVIYHASTKHATVLQDYEHPHLFVKDTHEEFNISKTNVYFQDYTFVKYKRKMSTSWQHGIGFLGGILGLCLGGSLISILEPIVEFLMAPLRRTYDHKVQLEE